MSDQQEQELQTTSLPITIHTQYIRDISFENPDAPNSMRAGLDMPEMNVNIGMDARALDDENVKSLYEVALTISATATRGDKTVFIAEVIYGVTVSIEDSVPEDQHHPLLLIEIPKFSFPFARQILATLTSQGGFPPLLMTPVDFQALYMERFKDEIAEARAAVEQKTVN
ncbi:MAG: protein-export chaperone SecB [Alphaproteobacteria bacterium]|nr:MAG: protein-export chaperone SecB [Alphaproteobacteria bacterium]